MPKFLANIKFILLFLVTLILLFSIGFISFKEIHSSLHQSRNEKIQNLTEIIAANISQILEQSAQSEIDASVLNEKIDKLLNDKNYINGNFFLVTDQDLSYFVITSTGSTSPTHPKDTKDKNGNLIFVEISKALATKDSDFFKVLWPSEDANQPNKYVKKTIFVKKIPNSNLLVGGGINTNDIDSSLNLFLLKFAIASVILILAQILLLYTYLNRGNYKANIPDDKLLLLKKYLNELSLLCLNIKKDSEVIDKASIDTGSLYDLYELQQQIKLLAINFSLDLNKSKIDIKSLSALSHQLNNASSYIEQIIKSFKSAPQQALNISTYKEIELLIDKLRTSIDDNT